MVSRTLKVSYGRKYGRSNYGSESATIELGVDVEEGDEVEDLLAAIGAQLRDHVARLLVDDGTDGQPQPTAAATQPAPAPAPAALGMRPLPRTPGRSVNRGTAAGGNNGWPRNAEQLYPWAKKQAANGYPDLLKQIDAWGAEHGCPWQLKAWSTEQVEELVAELRGLVSA